jgi:hypothetical protein
MILAAVYVHKALLFDDPQIINFGGKYLYNFELKNDRILIKRKLNTSLIQNYYGDLLMVSAIVGANGAGKTNILRILNQHGENQNSLFIYEDCDEMLIHNYSKIKISSFDFNFSEISDNTRLNPLFYSPVIDYDLEDIFSPISLTRKFKNNLSEYYFDNLERQLFFLTSENFYKLKEIFPELPAFESIQIKVNNFNKNEFLNIFKDANLGKGLNMQLEELWKSYNSNSESIHNDDSFLKNLEIMLLSLLVLDDTYAVTNDNGFNVGFMEVVHQKTFEKKLNVFLQKRISNIDGPTYLSLKDNYDFNLNNADELIQRIERNKLSKIAGGFDFDQIKKRMIQCISSFKAVFDFYNFLNNYNLQSRVKKNNSKVFVEFDIKEKNEIDRIVSEYRKLISTFKNTIQFSNFRILNFHPDKKLSTGEKSMLDFFSVLYDFTLQKVNHQRKYKNYLLLLDEPELGYHALWKKKFIESIILVVPAIFNDLLNRPKVQVIFTTHDALTLSDLLNYNVVYLERVNGISVLNGAQKKINSFGANITDILSSSFFVGDGLIGDYAKNKIQDVIEYINNENIRPLKKWITSTHVAKKVIEQIGEPYLNEKLNEMFLETFPEFKDEEIKRLEEKLKKLKDDTNSNE